MDIKYKILCVDDAKVFVEQALTPKISRVLKNLGYELKIDLYTNYDDFLNDKIKTRSKDCFEEYDLILVDYNLASKTESLEKNGANLIKEVRAKDVLTDILFYSQNYSDMKQVFSDSDLEGVYISKRSDIQDKVDKLASKTLKRELNSIGIRGALMDRTSYFDYTMYKAVKFFELILNQTQKQELIKFIHSTYTNIDANFIHSFSSEDDYIYRLFTEPTKDTKLGIKSKYYIFQILLEKYGYVIQKKFASEYHYNIINNRDNMAHKKITYSEDRTKIIFHNIDDSIEEKTKKEIVDLRMCLIKFNNFFESLDLYLEEYNKGHDKLASFFKQLPERKNKNEVTAG